MNFLEKNHKKINFFLIIFILLIQFEKSDILIYVIFL